MGVAFWSVVVVGAFFVWVIYVAVDLEVPAFLARWYREPGNSVRAMTWVGSLFVVLLTLTSPEKSFLGSLRNDAISIAIAVIVIEELGRYRTALEEKDLLIRQMGSLSNDFALDAARIIVGKEWHKDGSLIGKNFDRAQLQKVDLMDANLQKTSMFETNLRKAKLMGADLREADLWGADLRKADLSFTDLRGISLQHADLREAQLSYADLRGATLTGADLTGAILTETNLQKAKLMSTDLREVDLREAKVQEAIFSVEGHWSEEFDPQMAGAILVYMNKDRQRWDLVQPVTKVLETA